MKILIFGGGGFIGSNLAATLRPQGFSLKTMDNGEKSVTKADVALDLNHASETELTNLMLDVDVVINLVAESAVLSSSKPQEMYETNAFSAQKLYQAAIKAGVGKFFFTSTAGALFESGGGPKDELMLPNPTSHYGCSKAFAEILMNSIQPQLTKTYIFRLSNVFGNYMSAKNNLIPNLLKLRNGKVNEVIIRGDGTQTRDFIYVDDLTSVFKVFFENSITPGTYNLASGNVLRILDVIKILGPFDNSKVKFADFNSTEAVHVSIDNRKLLRAVPELQFTSLNKVASSLDA